MKEKAPLRIGSLVLANPFLLAPLAGVTDSPFRRICREQGAALVYSEMVSGKGILYNDRNTEDLLRIHEEEKPAAFQIFGSDPEVIGRTAERLAARENVLLDINMGCPVPKIVKNGEGSALLRDPERIYRLVKAAAEHAGKPVTAKIRLGWSRDTVNGVEVAQAIEAAGAAAVAVHGRTREQFYSGRADWAAIREIKKAVNIPVIGNGDVEQGRDALALLEETGCDFVMIARGAMGNPWIFRDALALWNERGPVPAEERPAAVPVPPEERVSVMLRHLKYAVETKGERVAVREMRKHVAWYTKGLRGGGELRRRVNTLQTADGVRRLIEEIGNNR